MYEDEHSKRTTRRHNSMRNFPPEFYDSLKKVRLTARALREFNRRNGLLRPVRNRLANHQQLSTLARFARQGGPDLTDLRGVSFIDTPYMRW